MPCLLLHTTHLVTFSSLYFKLSSCFFYLSPQPWKTSVLVVILETLEKSSVVHQFLCLPNTAGSIGGSEQQIVGNGVGKDTHACKDLKNHIYFHLKNIGQWSNSTKIQIVFTKQRKYINRTH